MAQPSQAAVALGMVATAQVFEIFSALNSSPWTVENVGADAEKGRSVVVYVTIAIAVSEGMGVGASILGKSWWPLAGTSIACGILAVVYRRALKRAGYQPQQQDWTSWWGANGTAPAQGAALPYPAGYAPG